MGTLLISKNRINLYTYNPMNDKQNVVYSYSGILYSHKRELRSDRFFKMYEPWKHYNNRKSPGTKGHISYDSVYMTSETITPLRQIHIPGTSGSYL
jgi:hypothetical protein